jgi:hypothetical protein
VKSSFVEYRQRDSLSCALSMASEMISSCDGFDCLDTD